MIHYPLEKGRGLGDKGKEPGLNKLLYFLEVKRVALPEELEDNNLFL